MIYKLAEKLASNGIKETKTHNPDRRCKICGKWLSIYNANKFCFVCINKLLMKDAFLKPSSSSRIKLQLKESISKTKKKLARKNYYDIILKFE